MILVDQDIKKALGNGTISIVPYNRNRLGSNSYDLTLGNTLVVYTEKVLDCKIDNPHKSILIPDEGYVLKPGELYLGYTNEYLSCNKSLVPCIEGKCFEKGTLIRMYDGVLRPIELLQPGDKVLGVDGPKSIKSTHTGSSKLYRITQSNGQSYTVNGNHILSLECVGRTDNKQFPDRHICHLSVTEFLQLPQNVSKKLKGYRIPAQYPEATLSIDPYMFGLWLGDGCHENARITVNKNDTETLAFLKAEFPLSVQHDYKEGAYTVNLSTHARTDFKRPNTFLENLKSLQVYGNKHIPEEYLTASLPQRLELLAGILDTDGYVNRHCYEITLANKALFTDVIDLAQSCGLTCKPTTKIVNGKTYFRTTISGEISQIPIRIKRKKIDTLPLYKRHYSDITIEEIGIGEYYGFELEGNTERDKLFFLKDYTVVHNSSIARLGISVHLTAGFGDCAHVGTWTLEITCVKPIRIYADMLIAQAYWTMTLGSCEVPYSLKKNAKYQNQPGKPIPSMMYQNFSKNTEVVSIPLMNG